MTTLMIDQVSRTFPARQGHAPTRALEPIDLGVGNNDFVTILGPSGCGKSTLLRIIAGLDRPTSGKALVGKDLSKVPRDKLPVVTKRPTIIRIQRLPNGTYVGTCVFGDSSGAAGL